MNRENLIEEFRRWQSDAVASSQFSCAPIRFAESKEWCFDGGYLRRRSHGFFSLAGIEGWARESELHGHQQVIILQPQIAINGFLLQRRDGRPHLLCHGRVEPGNVGGMQLAPTVQSTESNYRQIHGGRKPAFVDWFLEPERTKPALDVLQSEEATRYFGKYNRNVVVELGADVDLEIDDQFRWYDLHAIASFVQADNIVNTDARSVLACVDWDLLVGQKEAFADSINGRFGGELRRSYLASADQEELSTVDIIEWLSRLRARLGLRTRILPFDALANWMIDDFSISERERQLGFAVRQFHIVARGREVDQWDQPLIDSQDIGRLSLVCQRRRGTLMFLVKANREIGFLEGVQLAPTISIPTGRQHHARDSMESDLLELAADTARCTQIHRCRQSEEGGRFFRDENEYELLMLDPAVTPPSSDDYRWMTLAQIRRLIRMPGIFSMEFRGILSTLLGYL